MADEADGPGSSYQVLSAILQDSLSDSGDYEDPSSLLQNTPNTEAPPPKPQRQQRSNVPPPRPYSIISGGQGSQKSLLGREAASDSEGESGDEDEPLAKPLIVRQSKKGHSSIDSTIEQSMGRIDIVGDIVQLDPPFSFKSSPQRNGDAKSTDEIQNEGIYQGLKMTNEEKQRIGILPESMYMTLNLENWAEELENMSLRIQEAPSRLVGRTEVSERNRLVAKRRSVPVISSSPTQTQRPITPRFRGSVVRAPPLPPLTPGSTEKERMVYSVVENLLRSEASFLNSLTIAIDVYMKPLIEMAEGPVPILSKEQISSLFGPLPKLLVYHELFYTALTSRTMEWSPVQRVGDIFMSTFNTKEVIRQYSAFVNNFTLAMATLETCIKKKPIFVRYLRSKYEQSSTSLSLQGLLLKPIQRFPQFILFLQDLLKYTPSNHPDRVNLQIALARFEGIAIFLNEAKRRKEQYSVVQHLNSKVTGLPFQLLDGQRWLHRQDTVDRLLVRKTGRVKRKFRCLLLFNNILLCAATKMKNKRQGVLESSTGSRDFRATEGVHYLCKWHSPLERVELVEPDLIRDVWDSVLPTKNSVAVEQYKELKASYRKLEDDYTTMTRITNLVSTLHEDYPGLTVQAVNNLIRVLQRKLARAKEGIKTLQPGRLDISIPSRDGSKTVQHTYVFRDEKTKQNWLNALRYAKLHLTKSNQNAWAFADDTADEDFFEISHKLPLFVDSFRLSLLENLHSVQCAAKVGRSSAWLSSGDQVSAQITVVECVTPRPFIVECFKLDCTRVIDMVYIPGLKGGGGGGGGEGGEGGTMRLPTLPRGVTVLPPSIDTVWMGSQCGKLLVFLAASNEGARRCLSSLQLQDSITCIQLTRGKVFVATALGELVVFKRSAGGSWDLGERETITVSEDSIRCMCLVEERQLWLASKTTCFILDTVTQRIEGQLESACCEGAMVNRIVSCGAGVWLSYRGCPHIELYHAVTRNALQHIDLRAAMKQIVARHPLESKIPSLDNLHASCLMASSSYLWIGTSIGCVLIYRIPHLQGVPMTSGKPYLAMLCHQDTVRVLLTVKTMSTMTDTRVDQFISDERHRNIGEGAEVTDEEEMVDGGGRMEGLREEEEGEEEEEVAGFSKSLTPSLLDPSLIASVDLVSGTNSLPKQGGGVATTSCGRRRLGSSRSDSALAAAGDRSSLDRKGMFRTRQEEEKIEFGVQVVQPEEVIERPDSELNQPRENGCEDHQGSSSKLGLAREERLLISIEDTVPLQRETELEENGETQLDRESIEKVVRSYSLIGEDEISPKTKVEGDLMNFNGEGFESSLPPPDVDIPFAAGDLTEEGTRELLCSRENGEDSPDGEELRNDKTTPQEIADIDSEPRYEMACFYDDSQLNSSEVETPTLNNSGGCGEDEEGEGEDLSTMRRIPTPEIEETIYELVAPDDDGSTLRGGREGGSDGSPVTERDRRSASPYETPSTLERTGPIPPLSAAALSPSETLAQALPRASVLPQEGAIFVLTAGRGLLNLRPLEAESSSPYVRRSTGSTPAEMTESFLVAYEIEH